MCGASLLQGDAHNARNRPMPARHSERMPRLTAGVKRWIGSRSRHTGQDGRVKKSHSSSRTVASDHAEERDRPRTMAIKLMMTCPSVNVSSDITKVMIISCSHKSYAGSWGIFYRLSRCLWPSVIMPPLRFGHLKKQVRHETSGTSSACA